MKRPAFQFYPADWRKDTALQSCSLEARGLWHEMLCLMHECEPYGHLAVNGNPMKPAQVARLVGVSQKEYQVLLDELAAAGVPSSTEDGTIYSRRMVRDEHIRNVRAQAGKLGGNPNLIGNKDKQKVKQTDKQKLGGEDNHTPTPSSSSSASPTTSVPDGTGAEAPDESGAMTKDELWASGKSLLAQSGMPVKQCGTFVGGLVKDYGAEAVMDAVRRAVLERPADPASFLKATCQHIAGERKGKGKQSRHSGFDQIDYREGVNGDGSF